MAGDAVVSATPVYARIASELRERIRSGDLQDGDRLPGENALMERYGVARMTARQALATLRYEGLAVSRKGRGVFVRLFKPIRRHGSDRLSQSVWGGGGNIWAGGFEDRTVVVDHLSIDKVAADVELADQLRVPEGEAVLRRARRYVVDDRPVQWAVSWLPLDLVEGTQIEEADTGPAACSHAWPSWATPRSTSPRP